MLGWNVVNLNFDDFKCPVDCQRSDSLKFYYLLHPALVTWYKSVKFFLNFTTHFD